MTNLDDDRLELLERRLAERVTERVGPALFKLYTAMGVTAISVLSFVGWNISQNIKSEIKSEIKSDIQQQIQKDVQAKRDEINEIMSQTRLRSKDAKEIIDQVKVQLKAFQPQAEKLNNNIQTVKTLNETIQKLDKMSTELSIVSDKDLQPLGSSVESLQRQLIELATQVDKLNTIVTVSGQKPGGESVQVTQQRKEAIQSVISTTEEAEQSLAEKRKRTTVFFQFAGGKRPQAEVLSAALKKADYIVPGEDREVGAAGKHEVRYFYKEDKTAAERLAQDTTRALRNLGYSINEVPDIKVVSLVSYSGKRPSQGTIELWLEIPLR